MAAVPDTKEIFEQFLAGASGKPDIDALCRRYPDRAARLSELWNAYRAMARLLDGAGAAAGSTHTAPGTRYEVRGEIARGGMGRVLEVWDQELRRMLAMKVLREEADDGRALLHWERQKSRLLNEAQILGQLEHPGIVPIHEVGADELGRPFFTMLRVRGRAFGEVIDDVHAQRNGWNLTRAVDVLQRVCEAVAHAHGKGVVHRDLKPANVMVGNHGEVYVMDWGLAKARGRADAADLRLRAVAIAEAPAAGDPSEPAPRSVQTDRRDASTAGDESPLLTMDGDVLGTPSYMAPEQAAGRIELVDERADVYGAGAMLYHLLAGREPYRDGDGASPPRRVLRAVMGGAPRAIEHLAKNAPRELCAICATAMARERDHRYPTMSGLAEDLRAYLEGRVVRAHRTGPWTELVKWVRRNKGFAAAILVGVLGLAAVAVVQTLLKRDIQQQAAALRQRVYFNDIARAQAALERSDIAAMHEILERCPEDLRGWEWRHLRRVSDTSDVTLPHGAGGGAVSPDGRTLVTVEARGDLRFWDTESFTARTSHEMHGLVNQPVFSQDGALVFVTDRDGMLHVYDVARAAFERTLDCRTGGRTGFTLKPSPDGKLLAFCRDSGRLELWNAETLEPLPSRLVADGLRGFGKTVWSADGERLYAACADREADGQRASLIRVYEVTTRKLVRTLNGHDDWVDEVALSPDGRWLASRGRDNRILVWDLQAEGDQFRQIGERLTDGGSLAWTPNGDCLVTAISRRVQLWQTGTWTLAQTLLGHTSTPSIAGFLADGRLVTCARETKVWDLDRCDRVASCPTSRPTTRLAFSPNGEELAVAFPNGPAEIWSVRDRARLRVTDIACNRTFLGWTRSGREVLSIDWTGTLVGWDASSGTELFRKAAAQAIGGGLATDPDGRRIATSGLEAKVRCWTLDGMTLLWEADAGLVNSWPVGAWDCVYSPAGDRLAVGAGDGCLRIFDSESGQLLQALRAGKETSYCEPDFSPDGRRIVGWTYGDPRTVAVWDLSTGELLWQVAASTDHLSPSFSRDGTRILTIATNCDLVVRDAATGQRIVALRPDGAGTAEHKVVSPDRETIVGWTKDGRLLFWSAQPWQPR